MAVGRRGDFGSRVSRCDCSAIGPLFRPARRCENSGPFAVMGGRPQLGWGKPSRVAKLTARISTIP